MKVSQVDPYYEEVKSIQTSVKKLVSGSKVNIGKTELHGLEGILNGCGCTDNSPRTGCHNKGLGSITPGVMSAEQMANLKVEELNFTYPWDALLGKPATNFSVMFHGDPGSGKTTLLLKFVEYLANNFGKVLYVSSEEHGASTLVKKINALLPVRPSRLDFAANLTEPDLSQYDFIVLDSVNNLKLKLDDFKQLKKDHPQTSFIVVLQHTKEGNYRGGKDWEHDIEMAVKVEHGIANVYRTRYGVYGTLDFFSHFSITPDMFK
jgi:predicted ATP-dependent serine protease